MSSVRGVKTTLIITFISFHRAAPLVPWQKKKKVGTVRTGARVHGFAWCAFLGAFLGRTGYWKRAKSNRELQELSGPDPRLTMTVGCQQSSGQHNPQKCATYSDSR